MKSNSYQTIKAMHTIVTLMNNEEAYMTWINIIPDEANEEDFEDIANDIDMMRDCYKTFKAIMEEYGADGLYMYDIKKVINSR